MTRPCHLFTHFPHEVIDEIVWGPNFEDLISSLQGQEYWVRFGTKSLGEIWSRMHMIAVATRQVVPNDTSTWYMHGFYKNFEDKEKICTFDYDTSTGDGWIKLDSFKSVP